MSRYEVLPAKKDSVWIRRGRLPGDKFKGTQIAFEAFGSEIDLRLVREIVREINRIEEIAESGELQ